jgi:hypothetical protein
MSIIGFIMAWVQVASRRAGPTLNASTFGCMPVVAAPGRKRAKAEVLTGS